MLEAGGATFNRGVVDLGALIEGELDSLPAMPDRDVQVTVQNEAPGAGVHGDPVKLRDALHSLLVAHRRELVTSDELRVCVERTTQNGSRTLRVTIGGADRIEDLRQVPPKSSRRSRSSAAAWDSPCPSPAASWPRTTASSGPLPRIPAPAPSSSSPKPDASWLTGRAQRARLSTQLRPGAGPLIQHAGKRHTITQLSPSPDRSTGSVEVRALECLCTQLGRDVTLITHTLRDAGAAPPRQGDR